MGMNDKRTIIGLFLSVFLMMIGVGMIVAVMPQRYIALSGTPSTVGSLAAAFALTYLLVQFGVGRLADRYGFKPFLIAGTGYPFRSRKCILDS
jgi:MFS family permease